MGYVLPVPDPVRWARYECKYLIPDRVAEAVRLFVQPWVTPDPHAARSPSHSYRISSLYLDTPELRLFRETRDGKQNRIKLRVRTYSSAEDAPAFLEIKRRRDRIIEKARARISRRLMREVLERFPYCDASRTEIAALGAKDRESFNEFVALQDQLAARPIVHIGYERQAYMGAFQRSARVTFDRGILCAPAGERDTLTPCNVWEPVEPHLVVLELKFDATFPSWMQQAVHRFGLQRQSYSKYGHSIERSSAGLLGYSAFLSGAGMRPVTVSQASGAGAGVPQAGAETA